MSKVKALLDKRKMLQSGLALSSEFGQETVDRKRKRDMSESKKLLFSIDNHANRCAEVIKEMQDMFNNKRENIRQYPRVKAWIKELEEIENKLKFKPMVIAVIGNTGMGKSSLMNAILDKRDVLPTSGMKACTATVVEVVQNKTDRFDAEIEFLEEKEWFDELRKLCEDLTDENGVITKTPPDRNSAIYNSYCKMVALYGAIDKFDILSKKTELTKWLGQIKHIQAAKLDEFKKEVERYVEVQESGTDHCFWPIVKRVCLKLPDCDVCSSGAVLVDLPGRGDSNEARNAIAKSHLEKCDHIWIVSSIHRSINDRTAQELLGEQLRSQFYMNGQLDAVSFICTMTDMVNAKECQRELKQLEGLTKELKEELSKLNLQKRDLSKEIEELTLSVKHEQKYLDEAKSCLEDENYQDEDEPVRCEKEDLEKEVKDIEKSVRDKENQLRNLNSKLQRLKDQHNEKIKAIDEICAKVRNDYCETHLKERFASSYEEIKRASIPDITDEKEPEQLQIKRLTNNLKVFCCSSWEYQLLEHSEPNDAGPKVFSNVDDTQIPKLRNFVHELTSTKKKESLTDTLSSLDGFVSSVQSYLLDKEVMKPSKQSFTKVTIDSKLQNLKSTLDCNLDKIRSDLDDIFDRNLIVKLRGGASAAANVAKEICNRWGAQRGEGGLHHRTYQAAVKRQGVYIDVDFNEDLAQPILTKIAFTWGNTFMTVIGTVWQVLDEFKDAVLQERKNFLDELLLDFGIPEDVSENFRKAQECIASTKISCTIKVIQDEISQKHRAIPRIASPHIQLHLSDVYKECAEIKGKGMLERVKSKLTAGIDEKRRTMFVEIADDMADKLHTIKESIIEQLTQESNDLVNDLNTALEPLWDDNTILRTAFSEAVGQFSLKVKGVLEDFQSVAEGSSQKRQKLQCNLESPEPMQGCSK
ncbi:uncharacterized protein LOC123525659 [Mercenaria mercenaria]|uniref:uncharacterized protein LOC123525659 n=1 Tax=Mercenaria mercenaria TaxID=6596 RepID=UPI00234F8568|nr:uncharacterized protein LOC123525659 [Mercenaria mercenaria]XP_053395042.1 uncharacterized protein LOC123525659 [Mercenaria mercenaria]XP_053395043.1 uncharacterized protein LOC123525659 [Mercenaria mercenaria]